MFEMKTQIEMLVKQQPKTGAGSRRRLPKSNLQPRVYFSVKDETIGENIFNRHDRPVELYRGLMPFVLMKLGLPLERKYTWNPKAGCGMCPCSPGFVLTDSREFPNDIWVTVSGFGDINLKTVGEPVSLEKAASTMQSLKNGAIAVEL